MVFAKAPRAGSVKTRMSPPLSSEDCAALYEEMLCDVLTASVGFADRLALEPVIAFHPPDAVGELLPLAPAGFRLQPQRGEDLASRMAFAVREAFAAGVRRVLNRGSDSPALPLAPFETVAERLDAGDDVVLTPDQGGGYALVGLRRPADGLFDLPMSTDQVLRKTIDRADELGLRASLTEPAFDLDTVDDIRLLAGLSAPERADLCPRTVQFLSTCPLGTVL